MLIKEDSAFSNPAHPRIQVKHLCEAKLSFRLRHLKCHFILIQTDGRKGDIVNKVCRWIQENYNYFWLVLIRMGMEMSVLIAGKRERESLF